LIDDFLFNSKFQGKPNGSQRTTVKYVWIKQHEVEFSIKSMCRFMSVSRSAYYAWLAHPQSTIEKDDAELIGV